jgi:signal transduction histidine kinase
VPSSVSFSTGPSSPAPLALETVFENERLFRGQVAAFVLGTAVPVVASTVRVLGLGQPGFPITQVALGAQSVFWGYAVFRQQFRQQVPSVSRIGERRAFETLDDGVLVVDGNGVVLRANDLAKGILDGEDPVGERLDGPLAAIGALALADLPGEFRHDGRVYEVVASPVTDWHDDRIGRTVVVRDVTRLVTRQQRLEVLNRILRHNVRNDVTVIQGSAIEIGRGSDGRTAELAARIEDRSESLLSVSEKGRDVERLFDPSGDTWVDAATFVDELLAGLRERYPEGEVTTSVAVGEFRTDRNALRLVETALVYSGESPTVDVSVVRCDDGVRVVVADDGPGIPASELDPVREGGESSLRHSSGLGLWLVNWGAQALGTDLSSDVADGTTVSLTLPETPVSDRQTQVRQPE